MTPDEMTEIKMRWAAVSDFWPAKQDLAALMNELETLGPAHIATLRRALGAECRVEHLERQLAEKEKESQDWRGRWECAQAQIGRWMRSHAEALKGRMP